MSKDKQTVLNFLTPTKLLTSGLKPKSKQNKDYSSVLNPSLTQLQSSKAKSFQSGHDQNTNFPVEKSFQKLTLSRNAIVEEEAVERNSRFEISTLQNKSVSEGDDKGEGAGSRPRPQMLRSLLVNPPVSSLELLGLLERLRGVKRVLEGEIIELEQLLDQTSQSLHQSDAEFARIKKAVLQFTAQWLDAGYITYKQNQVDWTKYENVEKKSIEELSDLTSVIEKLEREKDGFLIPSEQSQLQQRIIALNELVEHIRRMKVECVNMRPTLNKQWIGAFEDALAKLTVF